MEDAFNMNPDGSYVHPELDAIMRGARYEESAYGGRSLDSDSVTSYVEAEDRDGSETPAPPVIFDPNNILSNNTSFLTPTATGHGTSPTHGTPISSSSIEPFYWGVSENPDILDDLPPSPDLDLAKAIEDGIENFAQRINKFSTYNFSFESSTVSGSSRPHA